MYRNLEPFVPNSILMAVIIFLFTESAETIGEPINVIYRLIVSYWCQCYKLFDIVVNSVCCYTFVFLITSLGVHGTWSVYIHLHDSLLYWVINWMYFMNDNNIYGSPSSISVVMHDCFRWLVWIPSMEAVPMKLGEVIVSVHASE